MISLMVGAGVVAVVSLLLSALFDATKKDLMRSCKFDDAVTAKFLSGCFSVLFFLAAVVLIGAACLYAVQGVL